MRRWAWLEQLSRRTADVLRRDDIRAGVDRIAERLLNMGTLAGFSLEEVLPDVPFERLLDP